MGENSDLNFIQGTPAVVIDKVSMTYWTKSRSRDVSSSALRCRGRGLSDMGNRTKTVEVEALNELSLVVEHGESVGIIGRNGSGKSTLLKLVGGQVPPTSGAVYATSTPVMLGVNAALASGLVRRPEHRAWLPGHGDDAPADRGRNTTRSWSCPASAKPFTCR